LRGPGQGYFNVYWYASTGTCPQIRYSVYINIDRAKASPGAAITAPGAAAAINYSDGTNYCSNWTGTIDWIAYKLPARRKLAVVPSAA
jgi:hypothetical protein